ncbi:hypothetical protein TUM12370_26090 [Salmonella enterica subsp. enterica serovar Choleraesuis]|nr:hypothetical protein TUM12370_26090 [Salmonella enterica subsp. enterica serovar Choleraesuis]
MTGKHGGAGATTRGNVIYPRQLASEVFSGAELRVWLIEASKALNILPVVHICAGLIGMRLARICACDMPGAGNSL